MIIKARKERADIKTVRIKHVYIYVLYILRQTRAVNSKVSGRTWPYFELIQYYIYFFTVQVQNGSDK